MPNIRKKPWSLVQMIIDGVLTAIDGIIERLAITVLLWISILSISIWRLRLKPSSSMISARGSSIRYLLRSNGLSSTCELASR